MGGFLNPTKLSTLYFKIMVQLLLGRHTCSVGISLTTPLKISIGNMSYRQSIAYKPAQDRMICFCEHGPCSYCLTTEDVQELCFFSNSQQVVAKEQSPGTASYSFTRLFLVLG